MLSLIGRRGGQELSPDGRADQASHPSGCVIAAKIAVGKYERLASGFGASTFVAVSGGTLFAIPDRDPGWGPIMSIHPSEGCAGSGAIE
jgi:hypothetical protein